MMIVLIHSLCWEKVHSTHRDDFMQYLPHSFCIFRFLELLHGQVLLVAIVQHKLIDCKVLLIRMIF